MIEQFVQTIGETLRSHVTNRGMRGFSLVEAMVGLTAGLILIAGVGQIYLGSRQTYRLQEAQARLQEDGRFVIDYLKRYVRVAGYRSVPWNTATVAFPARGATTATPEFLTGQVIAGSLGKISVRFQGAGDGNGHPGDYNGNPPDLVTDCLGSGLDRCDLAINTFSVDTSLPENPTLKCSVTVITMTGEQYEADPAANQCSVLSGTQRIPGDTITQPLVSGFGNLSILYGLDTDGDRAANQYVPVTSVQSTSWNRVVSVRIGFELRSEDNLTATSEAYAFNGSDVTDRRLRRSFETTIALRNRLP